MLKKYSNLLNLDATISKELFDGVNYPWEVLPKIKEYILMKGQTLGDDYLETSEHVWVHKSAKISASACIVGPAIIGESVNEFVISVINSRIKEFNNSNKPINQNSLSQYSTKITNEQHNKLIDKPILDKSTVNIDNEDIKETLNNDLNDNKQSNKTNPILGYIEDEMGGLSDKYSYLNINISPIHNYGYYQ